MKNLSLKVSLLVLTLLLGAVASFAQSEAVLSGVITDTGGEPLPWRECHFDGDENTLWCRN